MPLDGNLDYVLKAINDEDVELAFELLNKKIISYFRSYQSL